MNLEKIFKNIIIVNLGTFIIAIISVFYESDEIFKISDNLSGGILLSNDGTSTAELIILLTYFIIFFVSLYFIYKFKPFGKKLYTISFIAGSIITLISGPSIMGAVVYFLIELHMASVGAILAFLYFTPIKKKFN